MGDNKEGPETVADRILREQRTALIALARAADAARASSDVDAATDRKVEQALARARKRIGQIEADTKATIDRLRRAGDAEMSARRAAWVTAYAGAKDAGLTPLQLREGDLVPPGVRRRRTVTPSSRKAESDGSKRLPADAAGSPDVSAP